MGMNTEDFVTYEQAVRLKELGFDWGTQNFYVKKGSKLKSKHRGITSLYYNWNASKNTTISSPTLSQVAKWLREVNGLFISVWLCAAGYGWRIEKCGEKDSKGTLVTNHDGLSGDVDSGFFTTYEKALSAGIDAALRIIKITLRIIETRLSW